MGVNKRNVFIVSLLVFSSLVFNIVTYFRGELKYPLFYYHYIETDGNFFSLQYLRNINETDRVWQISLPEYGDVPLKINENFNGINFLNEGLLPNERKVNTHYVLQSFSCSINFEDQAFKNIYKEYEEKDLVISKIRYTTNTGKSAIVDIGKIVVTKTPYLRIDEEKFAHTNGGSGDHFGNYKNNYLSTQDFTLSFDLSKGLNKELLKNNSILVNDKPLTDGDFSIEIENNKDFFIEVKGDKDKSFIGSTYPLIFDVTTKNGEQYNLYCYFRGDYTGDISNKGVSNLRELREGER